MRIHTKFYIKIFEIDFVIEIKFLTPPQGAGQKLFSIARPFIWVTHTPNLFEFRPMVNEEIAQWMDRRTDGSNNNIPFAFFFKKVWDKHHKTTIIHLRPVYQTYSDIAFN